MSLVRVLFALLALPAVAWATEPKPSGEGWVQARKDAELNIHYRDNVKVGAREVFVWADIEATPATVYDVIGDFEHYVDFMPFVKESTVIERQSATELISYQRLSPPLVDNRDYYIAVKLAPGTKENGGVYKSSWESRPDYKPETKGSVRVRLNTGSWTIHPLDGGKKARVIYELVTHPGGSIPTWMANQSNTMALPDLFKAVRKRSAEVTKRQNAASEKK